MSRKKIFFSLALNSDQNINFKRQHLNQALFTSAHQQNKLPRPTD